MVDLQYAGVGNSPEGNRNADVATEFLKYGSKDQALLKRSHRVDRLDVANLGGGVNGRTILVARLIVSIEIGFATATLSMVPIGSISKNCSTWWRTK